MLTDNINLKFFMDEVASEREEDLGDGRVRVHTKGTITMLDEWVRLSFKTTDWRPFDDAIAGLREVRRARQKPAHSVQQDTFDQQYIRKQTHLLDRAYSSLHTLRTILKKHPACADVDIPVRLEREEIWMY